MNWTVRAECEKKGLRLRYTKPKTGRCREVTLGLNQGSQREVVHSPPVSDGRALYKVRCVSDDRYVLSSARRIRDEKDVREETT